MAAIVASSLNGINSTISTKLLDLPTELQIDVIEWLEYRDIPSYARLNRTGVAALTSAKARCTKDLTFLQSSGTTKLPKILPIMWGQLHRTRISPFTEKLYQAVIYNTLLVPIDQQAEVFSQAFESTNPFSLSVKKRFAKAVLIGFQKHELSLPYMFDKVLTKQIKAMPNITLATSALEEYTKMCVQNVIGELKLMRDREDTWYEFSGNASLLFGKKDEVIFLRDDKLFPIILNAITQYLQEICKKRTFKDVPVSCSFYASDTGPSEADVPATFFRSLQESFSTIPGFKQRYRP